MKFSQLTYNQPINLNPRLWIIGALSIACLFCTGCTPWSAQATQTEATVSIDTQTGTNESDLEQSENLNIDEDGSNENDQNVDGISNESDSDTVSIEPDVNDYVRVLDYIPDIIVDLRYATADNFTGEVIYDFTDAYLRYGTVVKLKQAQELLKEQGYRIKIWDAYRPFYAQQRMWEIYPNPTYVANPAKGMHGHNLGNTIDITLVALDGSEVSMPTAFDDFSTKADRDYSDIEPIAAAHAQLLEQIMEQCDFTGYSGEWWDYTDNTTYTEINDFIPASAS